MKFPRRFVVVAFLLPLLVACAQVEQGPESSLLPKDPASFDMGDAKTSQDASVGEACGSGTYNLLELDAPTPYDTTPKTMRAVAFQVYSPAAENLLWGRILAVKMSFKRSDAGGPAGTDIPIKIVAHQTATGPFTYYGFGSILVAGAEGVVPFESAPECATDGSQCRIATLGKNLSSGSRIMVLPDMAAAGVARGRFILEDVGILPHGSSKICWLKAGGANMKGSPAQLPLLGRAIN